MHASMGERKCGQYFAEQKQANYRSTPKLSTPTNPPPLIFTGESHEDVMDKGVKSRII